MEKKFSVLKRVEYARPIKVADEQDFLYLLQRALLLALMDLELLNNDQLEIAEAQLSLQSARQQNALDEEVKAL